MFMRIFSQTRYIVLLPVLGLFLASAFLFFSGGLGLLLFLWDTMFRHGPASYPDPHNVVALMEFVEQFLTGTVLYIVAVGLYGLFIRQMNVPEWLRIESLDELKHTVIGVVVAVLAVKFMGLVAEWDDSTRPLETGAAIGIVLVGLGIYMGLNKRHGAHGSHAAPHTNADHAIELVRAGEGQIIREHNEERDA